MRIRASSLDSLLDCPGCRMPTEGYRYKSSNMLARLGTAVHEPLAAKIAGQPTGDLKNYAVKHDVSLKELEGLYYKALRLFGEVKEYFTDDLQTERYHEITPGLVTLTGHIDIIAYNPAYRMVVIGDHKTGFLDGDHAAQFKTYGLLGLDLYPQAEKALTIGLRVRDYERDQFTYTRAQLVDWYKTRVEPLATDTSVNVCSHCRFCERRGQCGAYADLVTQAGQMIVERPELVTPKKLYDGIKVLEKLIEQGRQWLTDEAYAAGGALEYDAKSELRLRSQVKPKVVFGLALPVLREHLSEAEIAECVTVKKGALKDAIYANQPTGSKGKAFEGVMSQLADAGALQEVIVTQLVKRKKEGTNEPDAIETSGGRIESDE